MGEHHMIQSRVSSCCHSGENSSNRWSDEVRALVREGLSKQWRGDTATPTEVNQYKVHHGGEWKEDHREISGQFYQSRVFLQPNCL